MEKEKINSVYYDENIYLDKHKVFTNLQSSFQRYRISKVLQIYAPNKDEKVLDLGCGWGTFCFALAPLCKEVTGVDFSRSSIDLCNRLLKKWQFKNVKFICADTQNTGLKSEKYDVIVCADLFEHLYPETFEKTLDECQRLLKSRGKLIIWTPHRGHIFEILKNHNILLKKDKGHVDYKSMEILLRALKKRSFLIVKNYYTESHIPVFSKIERASLSFLPFLRRRIAILVEKK